MAVRKKGKAMVGTDAAASAASIYFFQTDIGKRHAKKLKGWMVRLKGEVLEKLEEAEEVTEPIYRALVDAVTNVEITTARVPRSEILTLATDLKRQWAAIKRRASVTSR